jgi:hypothetical protein
VRAYTLQATFPENRSFLGFLNPGSWVSDFLYFWDFEGGHFKKFIGNFSPFLP